MGEPQTHSYYPQVDGATIRSLRTPLRLVLIGWLFIFFDFTYGVSGWQIDFIHDAIGHACLILAYGHLNRTPSPPRAKRFILPMAAVATVGTIAAFCSMYTGWPEALSTVGSETFATAGAFATIALAWTMMEICREAGAGDLARAWKKAAIAVALLWGAPYTLGAAASLLLALSGHGPIDLRAGPVNPIVAVLAILTVLVLPLFWFGAAWYRTFSWSPPGPVTHCHNCGYELAGSPDPMCPECGTVFATHRARI